MDEKKDFEKGWEEYKVKCKKEIDEMRDVCGGAFLSVELDDIKKLHKAGYRKKSETAREIFDKMLGYIGSQQQFCIVDEEQKTLIDCDKLFDFVGKLAKEKYGVDLGE